MKGHEVAIIEDYDHSRFAATLADRLDEGFIIEHLSKSGEVWRALLVKQPPKTRRFQGI